MRISRTAIVIGWILLIGIVSTACGPDNSRSTASTTLVEAVSSSQTPRPMQVPATSPASPPPATAPTTSALTSGDLCQQTREFIAQARELNPGVSDQDAIEGMFEMLAQTNAWISASEAEKSQARQAIQDAVAHGCTP
ncbi:hypothetical protein [Nocardia transvalensis]|uniref:hypothetical protein n=1 Tax=Nocardia transvalensis TaxID=37333 RepID=UPI0018936B4F|nr:hypothetical protein [Nocardia transvalensis]MBF6332397.1 hypothetical protein [Nocardia transvalensis]